MSRTIADLDLIAQRAEAMALKITAMMGEVVHPSDLDDLHELIQHLVVIRQAVMAIKEVPDATT